jgi:hypothetical protein
MLPPSALVGYVEHALCVKALPVLCDATPDQLAARAGPHHFGSRLELHDGRR